MRVSGSAPAANKQCFAALRNYAGKAGESNNEKIFIHNKKTAACQAHHARLCAGNTRGHSAAAASRVGKVRKQMGSLIEHQSNSIRPFIENIDTVNELYNKPVRLLVDKENLYIATIA